MGMTLCVMQNNFARILYILDIITERFYVIKFFFIGHLLNTDFKNLLNLHNLLLTRICY